MALYLGNPCCGKWLFSPHSVRDTIVLGRKRRIRRGDLGDQLD